MNEEAGNWYYAENGKQIGPVTFQDLKDLALGGKVNSETTVWDGEGDWKPANKTALFELFSKPTDIPPPLTGSNVDNTYAWLVVAVPIIGAIIEFFVLGVLG